MSKKTIIGDLDVQGAIKHKGTEISYSGGGGTSVVTAPVKPGLSFKPNITLSDVSVLYNL